MQHSAICDHCDQVIVGVRYRCGHCADYDLCASCEALHQSRVLHLLEKADDDEHDVARSIHPITHVFLKVRYPLPPRHDTSLGAFYHSIDQMRKSWWANHALEPSSATCETSQPAHPFLLCDGCDCSIIGVRYMCINCLNTGYDLCAECDVRTVHVRDDVARAGRTHYINEHHQYHVFAKLYCPLPLGTPEESILLRNRLVRPPFYTPQLMLTYSAMSLPSVGDTTLTSTSTTPIHWQREVVDERAVPASTESPISIRQMCVSDIGRVLEIEEASFSMPYCAELFLKGMSKPNHLLLVAIEQSEVAIPSTHQVIMGYCMLRIRAREVELSSLAVGSQFRGQGVAGALLRVAVSVSRNSGAEKMSLRVSIYNKKAILVYKKLGFASKDYVVGYYHDHEGCCEDALSMELPLL